jgi:hypothetical protein
MPTAPSTLFKDAQASRPQKNYEQLTIHKICHDIKNKRIDMCPDYQRCIVWDDVKSRGLIESIWRGYPVPMIFMAETENQMCECVDGKNRIEAISRYVRGEIKTSRTGYADVDGVCFQDLSDDLKEEFKSTQLQVCIFRGNFTKEQRRHFFRCIQISVSLNCYEKIKSYDTHPYVSFLIGHHASNVDMYGDLLPQSAGRRFQYLKFTLNYLAMCVENTAAVKGVDVTLLNWVSSTDGHVAEITHPQKVRFNMLISCLSNICKSCDMGTFPSQKPHTSLLFDLAVIVFNESNKPSYAETESHLISFVKNVAFNWERTDVGSSVENAPEKYVAMVKKGASSSLTSRKGIQSRIALLQSYLGS